VEKEKEKEMTWEERHKKREAQIEEFWKRNPELADAREIPDIEKAIKSAVFGSHKKTEDGEPPFEKLLLVALIRMYKRAKIKQVKIKEESKIMNSGFFIKTGSAVKIRPCGKEYGEKTYFGIYIGDMALSFSGKCEGDTMYVEHSSHNPAIFVPELSRVIFGCESWWDKISSEEELKKIITDDVINNVWYVKMLKSM